MDRIILHLDVNSAFLSWTAVEMLNQGYKYDIRDSYAAIAGDPKTRSGIILASSTKAKKMGVKTAETIYQAKQKCSSLRIFPPDYNLYQKMSNAMFELLKTYTPDIEIFSIDECFIDYTKVKSLYGDELEFAKKIQKQIFDELGFTVNIGIGNNKLCAKMASNISKPNKINTLYKHELKKIENFDISFLFGVGKKTVEQLKKIGIDKIIDLKNFDQLKLKKYFKNHTRLLEIANGIDYEEVIINTGINKCISSSTTFKEDYIDKELILIELDKLATKISYQLRKQNSLAKVVGITIKDVFFKTINHQKTLKNATDITPEIKQIARNLFIENWNKKEVRLIGIKLDNLKENDNYQLSLFEEVKKNDDDKKIDQTIDKLKEKYGFDKINRGK